jgi:hypothetical protein
MDAARFETMVARLEQESSRAPTAYQLRVAALAALGFVILGLVIGSTALGLLLIRCARCRAAKSSFRHRAWHSDPQAPAHIETT